MNSIILKESELIAPDLYRLGEAQSKHLKEIVGVKEGDLVKATILNTSLAKGIVTKVDELLELKISEKYPGKSYPLHLIVGASRPPTMKKILEHATSLGIEHFHIVQTDLSEKSYLQSKIYQLEDANHYFELGLSQSHCFYKLPKVTTYKRIEDIPIQDIQQRFILSPHSLNKLIDQKIAIEQPSVFAIGSERGWTERELLKFRELAFQDLSISPSILRVEIATFSLCGLLNQLM